MGKYDFNLEVYGENTIDWIAARVKEHSTVLEFGCANGRLTKYLSGTKKCKVDIVEIDEESGTEASQYADVAWIGEERGNIDNYYWLENTNKYDYIIFADVLEHLAYPQDVLKKCKVVLKRDGEILVSVPNISHNSIIIDLINDKFKYNPTGIMDNTHLRFFTRESFAQMATEIGWTIIEEKAKNIRVGETEIKNSYNDIPRDIARELKARPQGNIYQYMFVLASNDAYLEGKCERVVSLDSTSYYKTEIQYEYEQGYDYRHSACKQLDPHIGQIVTCFPIISETESVRIYLLNCNCVLKDLHVQVDCGEGYKNIENISHNGFIVDNSIYFMEEFPVCNVRLDKGAKRIKVSAEIIKYDYDNQTDIELIHVLKHEQNHIKSICSDYEKAIANKEKEMQAKIKEAQDRLQEICDNYERELTRVHKEYEERIAEIEKQKKRKFI